MTLFTCAMPFPPSTNTLYRNPTYAEKRRGQYKRPKTKDYLAWIRAAEWDVAKGKGQRDDNGVLQTISGPVRVCMSLVKPDRRRRDLDNLLKAPLDLLCSCGVIQDDQQVQAITAEWLDKPGLKGAIVTVLEA